MRKAAHSTASRPREEPGRLTPARREVAPVAQTSSQGCYRELSASGVPSYEEEGREARREVASLARPGPARFVLKHAPRGPGASDIHDDRRLHAALLPVLLVVVHLEHRHAPAVGQVNRLPLP